MDAGHIGRSALEESSGMDVKEYYFTGGEPFMNTAMEGILKDTLAYAPGDRADQRNALSAVAGGGAAGCAGSQRALES